MTKTIRSLMLPALVLSMACTVQSAQAASATAGQAVYKAKCQMCHAADGSGNLPKAKANPLGGAAVQAKSDAQLKSAVTTGTGTMKPVAGVAGADLDNVIAFIRTLKK
ncbi:MAG: c-type cytochrome [Terracidiphilus sp.]|jgi:cytochrome c5